MSTPVLVNPNTLAELREVIGRDRLDKLVERFLFTLKDAFVGEGRPADELGREAHTLVSMSGMLGCDALCGACRALEHEVKNGGDVEARLSEAQHVRDATIGALANRHDA